MVKTYILADSLDGRTVKLLYRVSSLPLARKQARKFARQYSGDFWLVECRDGGERNLIHEYQGQYGGRGPFVKVS